jgi:C4-dicarboxylate-specific signal transduction histidine kinase
MLRGKASFEFRFRHKDGRWLWIRSIKRGHVGPDGNPEIISIWADITLEKQLADKLAHASKLAQLGEVTTGMAHELNQPLASISMAAENAKRRLGAKDPDIASVKEKLDNIVEQVGRISQLTDHMRVFGRMETPPNTAVRLQEVVANALHILAGKLKCTGVTVTQHYEDGLPAIMGASIPLEQVIINLISNACDAFTASASRASGDRPIAIRACQPSDRVVITIEDGAGGIPAEALPHVFEPFFTTKVAGQGTGLGLSISYGIITDMKGEISVANTEGGAAFRIDLPMAS